MKRFIVCGALMLPLVAALAGDFTEAKVTRVINEVRATQPGGEPRKATMGDIIRPQWTVSTGDNSRTELTFQDLSLVRLGANTVFDFKPSEREVDLRNGTILLQVPKKSGGATIQTAAVTAAITGTTVMAEFKPDPNGLSKWIVIEGELRVSLKSLNGESIVLKAGQMLTVPNDATKLPEPVSVNLERLVQTSKLITMAPFTPEEDQLIQNAVGQQVAEMKNGTLVLNPPPVNPALVSNNPASQTAALASAIQSRQNSQPPPTPPPAPPKIQAPPQQPQATPSLPPQPAPTPLRPPPTPPPTPPPVPTPTPGYTPY